LRQLCLIWRYVHSVRLSALAQKGLVDFAVDALFVFLVSLACALLVRCFFAAPHEE